MYVLEDSITVVNPLDNFRDENTLRYIFLNIPLPFSSQMLNIMLHILLIYKVEKHCLRSE